MADFNSVLNRLKKLKDSTDIDEKVGSFARGLTNATMQGYRQPVNNFRNNVSATRNFVSNLNPNKPIADPIPRPQGFYRPTPYQTPIHLKLGANLQSGIQSLAGDPRTGAKGNPYQGPLKVFEPIERGQKAILRRTLDKGVQRAGDRPIAGRVQQASRDVLGPKQSLGRDATDVLSMGATIAGLSSPLASAGYTAFGTVVRGLSNKLQGGKFTDNLAGNINQSFVEGVPMAGIGKFTNPAIEKATGGLNFIPRIVTKGALNMGEGVLMDRAAGFETTKESLLIDALMPAGFELSGTVSKQIAKAFKTGGDEGVKMFDDAIKNEKVNKNAIKPIKEYIRNRDSLGRFASKNATNIETKPVKEELRLMPDGSYRTFRDGKMATWFGEDKFRQLSDGSVVYKNPQNLMGGIAGVEVQRDEEGKPAGIKYNPVKGAIGVGAMAGYTKIKGSDDLLKEAKKYKSAEEFVNSNIDPRYNKYILAHNTSKSSKKSILNEGFNTRRFGETSREWGLNNKKDPVGISFSETKEVYDPKMLSWKGEGSTDTIYSIPNFKNPLIVEDYVNGVGWKDRLNTQYNTGGDGKKLTSKLLNKGYDGVVVKTSSGELGEIVAIKPSAVKNYASFDAAKAQLIDIYNQAQEPVLRVKQTDPLLEEARKYKSVNEPKNLIVQHNLSGSNLKNVKKLGGLPMPSIGISRKEYPLTGFGDISLIGDTNLIKPSSSNPVYNADGYTPRYPSVSYFYDSSKAKDILSPIIDNTVKYFKGNRGVVPSYIDNYSDSYRAILSNFEDSGRSSLENSSVLMGYFAKQKGVSANADYKEINKIVNNNQDEYQSFIDSIYNGIIESEKIFKGYTYSGNRRYSPHTLDNVVKDMKSSIKDGEDFNYGIGTLRSKVAKKYKNLEQIKADRGKIIPEKDMERVKNALDDEYFQLLEKHGVEDVSTFTEILADYLSGRITRAELNDYPASKGVNMTDFISFAEKLKNIETEYFEAKPKRGVGVDEFKVAVVPKGTPKEILDYIKSSGLKVYEYKDELERSKVIRKAAEENELAFGAIAGVEYERDENGNITGVKYNPVKGAIGVGAMAGYTKVKGSDDLLKEAKKYKSAEEFVNAKAPVPGLGGERQLIENLSKAKEALNFYTKRGDTKNILAEQTYIKERQAVLNKRKQLTDIYNQATKPTLKVKQTGVKQEAQKKLNDLLNYQDKLVKGGLKESEADNISYKQYQKMQAEGKLSNLLDNVPAEADNSIKSTKRAKVIETDTLTPDGPIDIPTNSGFKAEINKIFNPIKNAPAQVQSEVKNWSGKVMTGRAKASEVVNRFSNIDEADGWKFIQKFQDPNAKVDLGGKYEKEMVDLRNYYNSIREEGMRRGLDINYLDNYLNQVWKNPPEEVDKALAEYMKQGKSLGKNPSFTKKRVFDTYSDGIKYGLKPKYTHPGQLAAHYRYQLDKAIANRDLVNNLKRLGAIVPSNEAPAGWKTVDTQLIPDIDGFRAEPSVAKSLNSLFSLDKGNAFLRAGANASRYAQQVSLSGGIPGTPMNAFTLGNMIKEVTGGRVKSPVKSFVYAMSDSATKNYFKKNEKYSTMMAQEGIRSRAITDYDKAYKNLLDYDGVKGKGQAIADLWNSAMEKPTFERFMPMLELNTFKDTYEEAIKNGASSKEARRVAGETTKAWHGVADKLSRSTDVDNTLSAVFFAPTFRESMINFWGANAKAMNPKNWADPKYKYNKKFLGGMLVTYVLYNLVNKALTGHYLHENKDGKEFAIEIPRENGRSWFIPMLPSIGTLPRRGLEIAGALKGGDIKTAAQKFGSFFSQPINVGGSLLSNRTFYGGPIYTDEDTAGQKVGKLAGYGAEQLAHPYIGEPIAYMQGRKTPIEALMGAMELPVYPSKSTYASHLVGGQNTKFNSIVKASDDLGKQYAEGVKIKNALTSDKPTKKQLKVLNSVTPDKLDGIALAFGYDNYLGEKPAGDLEYKAYSNEVLSDARSVYNDGGIPESIKKPLIERMGQSYKDVELDAIAQKSVVDKAIYVRDELAKLETPQEKQQFLNDLYHNKTLSDKRIFTDSVAEELGIEDAYKIAQRYSKAKSGSGKKIKLGTTPTFKAPKISPIKVSATKRAESKPIKLDLKGYSGTGKNTSPIKLGRSKSLDSAIIKLRNLSN